MKILVTGANGQLGSELKEIADNQSITQFYPPWRATNLFFTINQSKYILKIKNNL